MPVGQFRENQFNPIIPILKSITMKNIYYKLMLLMMAIAISTTSCKKQVDYSNDINALKTSLQILQSRSDSLAAVLALTNSNVANLDSTVASIQKELATIMQRINQLVINLSSVNADITSINAEIASLNQQYADLLAILNDIISRLTITPLSINKGLVAWYPFTGNGVDSSNSFDDCIVNKAILTTDRFGNPNAAFYMSAVNNSSLIPNYLNTTMLNTFSYSLWVKPESSAMIPVQGQTGTEASGMPSDNPCVIHAINGSNFGAASENAGSGLYVGTNGLYVEEYSNNWEAVPLNYIGNLQGWHLISIIYFNKEPLLYIDGVFIKSGFPGNKNIYASLGPDNTINPKVAGFGCGYTAENKPGQYFTGSIDDIRYYNRELNQNELTYLASH